MLRMARHAACVGKTEMHTKFGWKISNGEITWVTSRRSEDAIEMGHREIGYGQE
jgi:hypothetical protein